MSSLEGGPKFQKLFLPVFMEQNEYNIMPIGNRNDWEKIALNDKKYAEFGISPQNHFIFLANQLIKMENNIVFIVNIG